MVPNYKVRFNPEVAYTILYEDKEGTLLFVFETEGEKTILLRRLAAIGNQILYVEDERTQSRVELAFERTKKFLLECGYKVERYDE